MRTNKFLFLFEKFSKNLFKEHRFVYVETHPKPDAEKLEDQAAKQRAAAEKLAKDRAEAKQDKPEKRKNEGTDVADHLAEVDKQLNEDLNALDQKKFDKIIVEHVNGKKDLRPSQVEALAVFAAKENPAKNINALFSEFKDGHLNIHQLTVGTVKIFLENIKNESDKKELIDAMNENEQLDILIQAAEIYPDILKKIFDSIKENKVKIRTVSKDALKILADKLTDLDFTELQTKISDKQKSELLTTNLNDVRKETIFQNLFKGKSFKDLDSTINEDLVKYICSKNSAENLRILFDNLEPNAKNAKENVAKLSVEACKTILNTIADGIENTEEANIFRGLKQFLSKEILKNLIEAKDLKFEIREKLYKGLMDKSDITPPVKEEPAKQKSKPDENKKAEKPEKGADKGTDKGTPGADKGEKGKPAPAKQAEAPEVFTKDMDWKDIIAKMGEELKFDGKSISWEFPIKDGDKTIISERSFRVSPRFLKELNKLDKGERANNTKDKIKLCAYRWLLEKIYKHDTIKKAKGTVVEFDKSQQYLRDEIKRLTDLVEKQPTEKKEGAAADKSKDKDKGTAPAADEKSAGGGEPSADKPLSKASENEILRDAFFSNFAKVENTTRTIEKGDYQLAKASTIYQADGPKTSEYQGHFQYFTVNKPEILKVTDKKGEVIYVVQAKDFQEMLGGKPTPSLAAKDKGPGYVNIEDIIKGHAFNPAAEGGEIKANISSEWTKEDKSQYKEDADLTAGKKYSIKPGTEYYTNGPKGAITSKNEVSLVDNKVREIEGKKYVQVKIDGVDKPVWIGRDQLIISEEDKFRISEKDKTEKLPASFKFNGYFTVTDKMSGSDIIDGIFKKDPTIKGLLEEIGMSKIDYLKLISKYREGNTLPIIVPKKELAVIIAEYKKKSINKEFQKKDSEKKTKRYADREDYFENPRHLKDKELIKAINSDKLWNDLLEKRPPYEKSYIDGLEKITDAMKKLGVEPESLRGVLKDLLQIGINEKITFKEVFDTFFKDKGKESSFSNFREEMDNLGKAIEPWQTAQGKAKIGKIDQYNKASQRLKFVMAQAEEQHTDYKTSAEYKEWETLGKATEKDRAAFYSHLDSEGKDTQLNVPEKLARLQDLKERILFPIADLLDSLESASVKLSVAKNFTDEYEDKLSRVPEMSEIPKDAVYYNLESLMKGEDKIEPVKDIEKVNKVTLSEEAKKQFDNLIGDLIFQGSEMRPQDFEDKGMLKLIFQLYTLDSLIKDKCIQKSPDGNGFVLNSLPKNFNAKQKAVSDLFKEVSNDSRIDAHKQKIKEISEILDKNKAVLKRLLQVFSKDQGPKTYDNIPIDLLGISYLVRLVDGKDRRELNLTMHDIGEGKDSLMTDNFLNRYLSDRAAFSEILSKVSKTENGATVYNEDSLKNEFNRKATQGLTFAIINSANDPILYKELTDKYGDLKNPDNTMNEENFDKARADLAKKINDSTTPLDKTTRELIRVGHVIDGAVEHGKEEEMFSKNVNIQKIQKALISKRLIKDIDDIHKVDKILGGGLVIPLTGTPAVGIFGQAQDLGGGWKLTPAIGVEAGPKPISAGVALTNGWKLEKDGRSMLTIGATAGYVNIGGAVDLQIPISEKVNADIGVAGGASAIGLYGLACVGFSKDLNAAAIEDLKEEIKTQGYGEIEKLIKAGVSNKEVADALVSLPGHGNLYSKYRAEGVNDEGLLEIYKKIRESIDAKVAKENSDVSLSGGGIGGGIVNGIPVAFAYLSFVVGEKTMIVRRVVPGAPEVSDEQVKIALEKQLGKNVDVVKKALASASGDIVYDAQSHKMAILEGKTKTDFKKFDSFENFNTALEKAHMGISKEKDGSIRLHIDNPGEAPSNIKVIADPMLKEIGVTFTVVDNKIIFKGLSEKEMREFIITRENFHYPFNNEGANKLSIITIKNNPERSRAQIEQESPNIIYQADGYKPEIRSGIGEGKSEPIILEKVAYEKVALKREDTLEAQNLGDFNKWSKENREAHNVISEEKFGTVEDAEKLFKFADKFYAKNKKLFRELTTITSTGEDKYDPEKLTGLIQAAALKDKSIHKELNSAELNQLIIHMISKTFVDAKDRRSVFERNLKFAEKRVIKPFLETAAKDLKLGNTPEEQAKRVELMLARVDTDMREVRLKTDPKVEFEPGTLFLSAVGTMKVNGLRGTPYYGSALDDKYGIINFNEYNPGKEGVEGDLGKAILGILSPLDTINDQKFMESPIAKKIGAMDAMYLVLGGEDAKKVTACFKTKEVKPENKAAFDKFKEIVVNVRDAENQGRNWVDLGNDYQLMIKNKIGLGNYTKCTNPTMAGNEDFAIYGPATGGIAIENEERVLLDTEAVRKATELIIGVKAELPQKQTPPPKPPKPTAQDGGETGGGTGGDSKGGAGQGLGAKQGNETGGGTGGSSAGGVGQGQSVPQSPGGE